MQGFYTIDAMKLAKDVGKEFYHRVDDSTMYELYFDKGKGKWECNLVKESNYMKKYRTKTTASIPEVVWQINIDPPEIGAWYRMQGGYYFRAKTYNEQTGKGQTKVLGILPTAPFDFTTGFYEKVTDAKKIIFLEHDRIPDTWKVGDRYVLPGGAIVHEVTEAESNGATYLAKAEVVEFVENRKSYKI